jgi:hypothetical protein
MTSLTQELMNHYREITKYVHIGYARWDDLIARVRRQEESSSRDCDDEQIWTFVVACGYAMCGQNGVASLGKILTGIERRAPVSSKIWLEVLPIPPRQQEGETHIDLALGTIRLREGTESGIQLDNAKGSWICFCEMKWYSDISVSVSYDVHRNQLARVIENALCFQSRGKHADRVHVTLVTPAVFRDSPARSRLYQYKFREYDTGRAQLMGDLTGCILDSRDAPDWFLPTDLPQRVESLSLRWATFDELFESLPDSVIASELRTFWVRHGDYQGRTSSSM